jgi:flagellar hook protein FlgE
MLWGAFNNASSAMQAMSWDMGSISQNIANVNTTGYKRKETLFQTVMSESHAASSGPSGGRLNIFGVQTADRYHIEAQGVIAPSNHWSDLAINGSGFFLVSPPGANNAAPTTASTDDPTQVLYTRDGAFSYKTGANGENYFITSAGHHLMGYMADETGDIPATGMLEAVYTTPTTVMEGRATTTANVNANIPSDAEVTPSVQSSVESILDGNGAAQDVTLTWTRTDADSWTVAASCPAFATAPADWSVTMDAWGNISDPTNTNPLTVLDWAVANGGPMARTVNIASSAPNAHIEKISISVFDDAFEQRSVTLGFERIDSNQWYMHVDGGTNETVGASVASVLLNFDGAGQLVSPTDAVSAALSWTSGTDVSTATVDLDISSITQFNGDINIISIDQDGYGEGNLMSTGFNEMGLLTGHFTNGESRALFKLPVAQFVSENNLDPISGNLFRRTQAAGDLTVAGVENQVGQPRFVASSLEQSTVDIEDEFTKMIVTQKAYSTNATVFKTADEMTTVARDLKA